MHIGSLREKRCHKIESILKANPGISASRLNQLTPSISEEDRQDILEDFIVCEEVRVETTKAEGGRGRPTKRYFWIWPVKQQQARGAVQPSPATPQLKEPRAWPHKPREQWTEQDWYDYHEDTCEPSAT